MNKFLRLLFVILLTACSNETKVKKEISKIDLNVKIDRFDKVFANATPSMLPSLKKKYPYLFPKSFDDSIWIQRMNDSLQKEIYTEIQKKFKNFEHDSSEIKSIFQHVTYYFNDFTVPKIITLISDVDYKNRVIYADSLLLLGLDNYLGASHRYYGGIQEYIRNDFEAFQIPVDIAKTIARSKVNLPSSRSFLAQLIYYGKLYYLIDLFYSSARKENIIGYNESEYKWALANENHIWRYFVEKELLFSTDAKLEERFINPAPFSKFYLGLDNESPGRIGQFIGWQIVNSYMENNEVSLQRMLDTSAEEIFNKSKYKPEK